MSTVFIYFYPIGLVFATSDWLKADWKLILDWCIRQNMFLIFLFRKIWSRVCDWLAEFYELICLLHVPTWCVFDFQKQFSVVVSASLIDQSSLSFITVLHMIEHVLFYYQRQRVVSFITISYSVWLSPPLWLVSRD